jgi:methylenetetrahydrofolate dehydrogenase (NADP+)/methenyltetrahydrofolate cyclohydrolase
MTDTAQILDGREVSQAIRRRLTVDAAAFTETWGRKPGLAVVIVGDNPASHIYVRQKAKSCGEVGFHSLVEQLPGDTAEEALLARIRELNDDPAYDGILVQLPLPPQINEDSVIETISPAKHVDGFHPRSVADLVLGRASFVPCTPLGIMKMLEHYDIDPKGKDVVIIGRSNIVGKPAALLFLQRHATVTICHSRTRDLAAHTKGADIVVAAVGVVNILTADMVREGVVVIDVGMNRLEGRKVVGDVDFEGLLPVASAITPVPGGVGPMTITMLLANTLRAARLAQGEDPDKA